MTDEVLLRRIEQTIQPNRRFQNSPLSAPLISGAPGSVWHYARWFGRELHWRMYSGLESSVRTGKPWAVNEYSDKTPSEVLAEHPADGQLSRCS
jgi:hypothetical protein